MYLWPIENHWSYCEGDGLFFFGLPFWPVGFSFFSSVRMKKTSGPADGGETKGEERKRSTICLFDKKDILCCCVSPFSADSSSALYIPAKPCLPSLHIGRIYWIPLNQSCALTLSIHRHLIGKSSYSLIINMFSLFNNQVGQLWLWLLKISLLWGELFKHSIPIYC